ncbi:MAG: hypothetical protein ACKVXR_06460 [Planctomycetota bacterium]
MATSQAVSEGAGSGARSKASAVKERSLSLVDAATLALIAIVVVLVSLPRLRRFALRENETDAIAMLRILAVDAIANREALDAGGLSALLAASTGHRVRLEDVEVLDDGRLRRHGYVFESVRDAEDRPVLLAWPWDHGRTGVAAFAVEPGGPVLGLPNGDGRFTGLASPPRDMTDPWRVIPGS